MWAWSRKCSSQTRLDGKTAIITGCNTGLGKRTAEDFYLRGCRVIMACRDLTKGETAKKEIEDNCTNQKNVGVLVLKHINLASLKSVRACAQQLLEEENRIDLLINNAGIGSMSGVCCHPLERTEDGFETHMGVNHLAHFLLTLLLLPKLLEAPEARIVHVASLAHRFYEIKLDDMNWEKRRYDAKRANAESKLCNVLFTKELARRLEGSNVKTYALHPGIAVTDITRSMNSTILPGFPFIFKTIGRLFLMTDRQGAQTTIYCAVDDKAGKETGMYYSNCSKATSSRNANDPELAKKMWQKSAKMVGLVDFDPFVNISKKEEE